MEQATAGPGPGNTTELTAGDGAKNVIAGTGNDQAVSEVAGPVSGEVVANSPGARAVTTTTTTTTEGPRFEANPQFFLGPLPTPDPARPYDAIMIALGQQNSVLGQQNNVLSRLESKFDNHYTAVDTRFRALEKSYNTVEIAIHSMEEKLRIIDKANAELEHASNYRGQQNAQLVASFEEIKVQFTAFKAQVEELRKATSQPVASQPPREALNPRTVASYILLGFFLLGVAFFMGLGYYVMRGH